MISSVHQFSPQRQASFKREGDTLLVSDASHQGCRCPGDFFYAIKQQSDSIEITGSDQERGSIGYVLSLGEKGVQVKNIDQQGEGVVNVVSSSPLNSQQQAQLGLNVVSSLIGIPLLMETPANTPSGHTPEQKQALLSTFEEKSGKDPAFPDPNDGYYGTHLFLMEGNEATKAAELGHNLARGEAAPYDAAQHSVVVTANSFDEPTLGVYVLDRQTQALVSGIERTTSAISIETFSSLYPEVPEDEAMFGLVGELASRGEKLGVVAGDDKPSPMDFSDWKL